MVRSEHDCDGVCRRRPIVDGSRLIGCAAVLKNDGHAVFDLQPCVDLPYGPTSAVRGDFNGDGATDVAIGLPSALVILSNTRNGGFIAGAPIPLHISDPAALVAGDLDGDGRIDLAVDGFAAFEVELLWNAGGATFQATTLDLDVSCMRLAIGDPDADGDLDLLCASHDRLTVLRNDGHRYFTPMFAGYWNNYVTGLLSDDLDGDGVDDVAVAASSGLSVVLSDPLPAVSRDANGDRVPDECQLTPSATASPIASRTASATAPPTPVVCAGDCNGDGRTGIDEIIRGVAMALGTLTAECDALDRNHDGVTVDELVRAVAAALIGCN